MTEQYENLEKSFFILALLFVIISILCKNSFSVDVRGSFRVGNAPPDLNSSIPNQSWNMNSQKTGLDLDNYFTDADGDNITYNYSTDDNPHINISLDSGNSVTFTPDNRWNGTEHVVFYASDGIWEATSSNNVTLNVLYANAAPTILTYTPSSSRLNISEQNNQTFTISFTDGEQDNVNVTWKVNGTSVQQTSYILPNSSYTNSSSYIFTTNYSSAGIYSITVVVSDGTTTATLPAWTLNVTDVNRVPYFTSNFGNLTWNQGSSYTIDTLNNYASDLDLSIDDSLSFDYIAIGSPSNITVTIDPITDKVTFKPYTFFYGTETFYFKVVDSKGAYNFSNNFTLTINQLTSSSNASSSGAGGKYETCENYYYCSKWSRCSESTGTKTRTCIDLAECYYRLNPPSEEEDCTYMPSCYDKRQNQGEDLIDCGGPCDPCWTCYDGIKNQDEEGIDCGGPCKACATCDDGIKNCHRTDEDTLSCEDDVDCGGPCMECELYSPLASFFRFMKIFLISGAGAALLILALFFGYRRILPKIRKKEEISAMEEHTKDINKIERELNSSEREANTMPIHNLLAKISGILNMIIYYKFKISEAHTQKELIEKMSEIKGDHLAKDVLLKIHSLLYDMKFSGDGTNREDLVRIIDELKIINWIEAEKLSSTDEKKDKKVLKLYRLYLEEFYYAYKNNKSKLKETEKAAESLIKKLSKDELKKINHSGIQKRVSLLVEKEIEEMEKNAKKKINTRHFEHHAATMVLVLVMAGIIGILLLNSPLLNNYGEISSRDVMTGFVVYDEMNLSNENGESTAENISEEPIIVEENLTNVQTIEEDVIVEEVTDNLEETPVPEEETQGSGARMGVMGGTGSGAVFVYPTANQVLTSVEDNYTSWLLQGSDAEGDNISFGYEAGQSGRFLWNLMPTIVSYNYSAAWLNFTPNETYVWDSNKVADNYSIRLTITDGSNGQVITVYFNVTNVNDAPTIPSYTPSSLTPSVAENSSLTFTYDNTSADPDQIHPGIESVNQTWYLNGVLNNTNLSWGYIPGFCDYGTHNVTLNVTDLAGNYSNKTWTVTVTNTNRAPINNKSFSGYNYVQWTEGGNVTNNITLSQFFNDTDKAECSGSNKDNLTYGYSVVSISSVNNSDYVNVSINSTTWNVSFYPSANWYGVEVIRFFANDSYTVTYSDVNITLNVTNVNDAPVLSAIPNQNATINILFTYNVTATDPDNDTLTFADNTSLFNISNTTGAISFTPGNDAVGNYSIRINVSDPSGLNDSVVFNLTINMGNRVPSIDRIYPYAKPVSDTLVLDWTNSSLFSNKITSFNTSEDTTVLFNHTSVDLDGDTLNCTWYLDSVLVKNESCTNISYWSYSINFTQSGTRNVTAFVDDMKNSTKDYFTWNFSVADVNRQPTFGKKNLTDYSDFSSGTVNRTNITMQLGNITLAKSGGLNYYTNGTYLSAAINLQADYSQTNISSITWSETKPSGTNIFIRVRTANGSSELSSAEWSSWYNTTQIVLNDSKRNYVQFEANMTTSDVSATPTLESFVVNYEIKQYDTVTGTTNSWIDLDNYFSDLDTDNTLQYGYEIISGSSVITLTIDSSSHAVRLGASSSGSAVFRFYANDSSSQAYSNNVSVTVEIYTAPTSTTGSGGGGGGGGAAKTKIKVVEEEKPYYLQLVYVKPLETVENREMFAPSKDSNTSSILATSTTMFRAPILLNNSANETLTGIHLSAKASVPGISFEFKDPEVDSIESQGQFNTELYITQSNSITGAYSVDVIANIDEPQTEDVTTININPLSNLSKKVQSVMDMIKLNPICRELEEVVIKAQAAIDKKDYKEAEKLLDDAISGCKYLVAASQKENSNIPKKSFVLGSKWLYISAGLFISLLIASYLIPKIANRNNIKKFEKRKNKKKTSKK